MGTLGPSPGQPTHFRRNLDPIGGRPFQVAPDHSHFVEAIAQGVLGGVQGLLCGRQILVGEVLGV